MALPDVVARFDAIAQEHAHAQAVRADDALWSFAELQEISQRLSIRLIEAGVRPGDVVALDLGRSAQHIAGMLAAWRAGAAFLPIDPTAPSDRVLACLRESRARVRLTRTGGELQIERLTSEDDPLGGPDDQLAYVIYTSGSTGRPKGVRVSHRGLVSVLRAQIDAFRLAPGKHALLYLSTAFDASISDIGTALLSGASLTIPASPPSAGELAAYLKSHRITHADLPPSLLPVIPGDSLPETLETVVIGGEVCAPGAVRDWAGRVRLVNVYGPTEATICTSLGVCDAGAWERPLIGAPLPHVEYRLDGEELLIGGEALALGYVDRPQLDEAKFQSLDGRRYYRTGDRVRRHSDGSLEFLGRIDRQIKLRGKLVAPEEIEARLRAIEGVHEAAVLGEMATRSDGGSRVVLTAFVAAGTMDASSLRARLARTLPEWMLPRIVLVDRLSRGATGKFDASTLRRSPAPIRDSRVQAIAEAFAEVLGVHDVAEEDDFAALGGDSLDAMEVAARLQLAGMAVDGSTILSRRTPARIAAFEPTRGQTVRELERMAAGLAEELRPQPLALSKAKDWLLTGGTGFLGRRLLSELLARTDARIHCIIRAENDQEAHRRLAIESDRVCVYAGDVAASSLGLSSERWQQLAETVGHVVHAAAIVNLALPFESLAASNVRGALEVARFVQAGARKQLHLISSLAVLASTDDTTATIDEQTKLSPDVRVFGGYSQTKFVAEQLILRAIPEAQIIRPGLLTGDSVTGAGASACPLMAFIRGVAALGCLPAGGHERLRFDVTPIDFAAPAIAEALMSEVSVAHVSSAHGVSLAELTRALRRRVEVDVVEQDEFLRRARHRLPRASALALVAAAHRLLGGDAHRDADLFLLTNQSFRSRYNGPRADEALLLRYVDTALGAQS